MYVTLTSPGPTSPFSWWTTLPAARGEPARSEHHHGAGQRRLRGPRSTSSDPGAHLHRLEDASGHE